MTAPDSRQETQIVNKLTMSNDRKDISSILSELLNSIRLDRCNTKSYKELSNASNNYTTLLKQIECQGINNTLNAYAVYKNKFAGSSSSEVYEFFLALPYLA